MVLGIELRFLCLCMTGKHFANGAIYLPKNKSITIIIVTVSHSVTWLFGTCCVDQDATGITLQKPSHYVS